MARWAHGEMSSQGLRAGLRSSWPQGSHALLGASVSFVGHHTGWCAEQSGQSPEWGSPHLQSKDAEGPAAGVNDPTRMTAVAQQRTWALCMQASPGSPGRHVIDRAWGQRCCRGRRNPSVLTCMECVPLSIIGWPLGASPGLRPGSNQDTDASDLHERTSHSLLALFSSWEDKFLVQMKYF